MKGLEEDILIIMVFPSQGKENCKCLFKEVLWNVSQRTDEYTLVVLRIGTDILGSATVEALRF